MELISVQNKIKSGIRKEAWPNVIAYSNTNARVQIDIENIIYGLDLREHPLDVFTVIERPLIEEGYLRF